MPVTAKGRAKLAALEAGEAEELAEATAELSSECEVSDSELREVASKMDRVAITVTNNPGIFIHEAGRCYQLIAEVECLSDTVGDEERMCMALAA